MEMEIESRYEKYLRYIRDEVESVRMSYPFEVNEKGQLTCHSYTYIHDLIKGTLREKNWEAQDLLAKYDLRRYLPGALPDHVKFDKLHEVGEKVQSFVAALSPEEFSMARIRDAAILLDLYLITYKIVQNGTQLPLISEVQRFHEGVALLGKEVQVAERGFNDCANDTFETSRKESASRGGKAYCVDDELLPMINAILARDGVKTAHDCWRECKKMYSAENPYCSGRYSFFRSGDLLFYTWESKALGLERERSIKFSTFKNKVTLARKSNHN